MRDYYYLNHDGRVVRISTKRKPSAKSVSKRRGTWVIQEFDGTGWSIPVFPEITWPRLSRLSYIGSIYKPKITGLAE